MNPAAPFATHEVPNQPPLRGDRDLWAENAVLREAVLLRGGDAAHLARYGRAIGTAAMREAGREANRHPPELCLFDRGGRRLDEVAFHPAYHARGSAPAMRASPGPAGGT